MKNEFPLLASSLTQHQYQYQNKQMKNEQTNLISNQFEQTTPKQAFNFELLQTIDNNSEYDENNSIISSIARTITQTPQVNFLSPAKIVQKHNFRHSSASVDHKTIELLGAKQQECRCAQIVQRRRNMFGGTSEFDKTNIMNSFEANENEFSPNCFVQRAESLVQNKRRKFVSKKHRNSLNLRQFRSPIAVKPPELPPTLPENNWQISPEREEQEFGADSLDNIQMIVDEAVSFSEPQFENDELINQNNSSSNSVVQSNSINNQQQQQTAPLSANWKDKENEQNQAPPIDKHKEQKQSAKVKFVDVEQRIGRSQFSHRQLLYANEYPSKYNKFLFLNKVKERL